MFWFMAVFVCVWKWVSERRGGVLTDRWMGGWVTVSRWRLWWIAETLNVKEEQAFGSGDAAALHASSFSHFNPASVLNRLFIRDVELEQSAACQLSTQQVEIFSQKHLNVWIFTPFYSPHFDVFPRSPADRDIITWTQQYMETTGWRNNALMDFSV